MPQSLIDGTDPAQMQVAPRMELARALIQSGADTSPAYPMQAIARAIQPIAGHYIQQGATSELARLYASQGGGMADALEKYAPGHPLIAALRNPETAPMALRQAGPAMIELPKEAESKRRFEVESGQRKAEFERPYHEQTAQQAAQLAEQKRQHDVTAGAPTVVPYGAGLITKSGQWIQKPGITEGSNYDPNPAPTTPPGMEGGPDETSRREPVKPPRMGGTTSDALAAAGEQYALTGKLGPGYNNNRDPMQRAMGEAAKSYGIALANHRGIKPEELAQMWQNSPRWAGWIMGADGRAVGALGTAVDHLDTARELFKALDNGDTQLFNTVKNKFKEQFGYDAPTSVKAVAPIVGTEVMKAVGAAGAGSAGEREEIAKIIGNLGASPAQNEAGITALQKLIAGQLRTKQRQAEAIDLPKGKFEKLVGTRGLQVLGNIDNPVALGATEAPKVGDRKQFKQGVGVWDGTKWVPAKD